jgi:dinuclear metal center YbgI/SA1388 family protein
MILRDKLVNYLNQILDVSKFQDYCPNGLQVEGKPHIRKIVTGVTACQALLDRAVELNADAVLVHHGYFWKNEAPQVTGIKKTRLKTLLAHDMNLLAYHLPLDAHSEFGNNVQLANKLSLNIEGPLSAKDSTMGLIGKLSTPISARQFAEQLHVTLGRQPLHIEGQAPLIETIAWCTGAAQSFIEEAYAKKADAYLSGEISESTVHFAKESGIHYFAAGHHATERYGVQALGQHLAEQFGLDVEFVDIDNPV